MIRGRKRVAFHTLGCKLNFAETSTIARSLPEDEYERVSPDQEADVYIINTCSVTDAADRKCRQAIRKFIHRSPGAFIAVIGCYAQLKPQEISSIPGVDLILGSNEKFDLGGYLSALEKKKAAEVHTNFISDTDSFYPSWSMGDRTRSFLKVQDGCDYGCSYCTIPMARGRSRNPSIKTIEEEARRIAEKGIKEIVLTGVNIGDFGKTTGERFTDMLAAIEKIEGIERIRLSSVEPNLLDDGILAMAASSGKILPHFHLPLQSGSNRILGLMKRRYRRELFSERINRIREYIPDSGIGADVIVGFPGEDENDFAETYSFLEQTAITYLHVFSYSERPGTAAEKLPVKVPPREKERRSKMLMLLSDRKTNEFCLSSTGKKARVLFESSSAGGLIEGFTGNYIRVEHPFDPSLAGMIRDVIIRDFAESGNMNVELI